MKSRFNITKLINFVGVILFIISFLLLCYDKVSIKYNCLLFLFSSLLMLPDSVIFIIRKTKENDKFGIYWLLKFCGLIIAIIIFLIGFIYSLGI